MRRLLLAGPLPADSLLWQLQATSTEDVLRMLDEEQGLGAGGL